jgi:hypothetical protein
MTDSIELRKEDWEKLQAYHEELSRLIFDTHDFLNRLLQIGTHSTLETQAIHIYKRMEPIAKFLFSEEKCTNTKECSIGWSLGLTGNIIAEFTSMVFHSHSIQHLVSTRKKRQLEMRGKEFGRIKQSRTTYKFVRHTLLYSGKISSYFQWGE